MSLTAAGFLGLSSVTGHLIMRPLALPDRKHAFCFSRNDASQMPPWILSKCKAFPQLITKLLFRQLIPPTPFLPFKFLRGFGNESEDYWACSAHWRPRKLFIQVRKCVCVWGGDIIIINVFTRCGSEPTGSNNSTVCCTKQCSFVNNLSALGNSIWNSVALQSSLRGTQVKQRTVWDLAFKYRQLCQCVWHAVCYCMCLLL